MKYVCNFGLSIHPKIVTLTLYIEDMGRDQQSIFDYYDCENIVNVVKEVNAKRVFLGSVSMTIDCSPVSR